MKIFFFSIISETEQAILHYVWFEDSSAEGPNMTIDHMTIASPMTLTFTSLKVTTASTTWILI